MELGIIDSIADYLSFSDGLNAIALIAGPCLAVFWSQKMAGDVRRENNLRDERLEKRTGR